MEAPLLIQNGRVIDPARGIDERCDLYIEDGRIAVQPDILPGSTRILNANRLVVAPGFRDIHVHFREPGGEEQETILSGSAAAAHGGFTQVVAMPNTRPAIDSPEQVRYLIEKGEDAGFCKVMTTACITRNRAGKEVADLAALKEAGAVAFTDDGCTVQDDAVMEEAMRQAAALGIPIMDHAQDSILESRGVMHEGQYSRRFNLPGIPTHAEARIVERDIALSESTGCHLHIQHVTSGEAVKMIRDAKLRGVRVTAELSPHHLALCDADIKPDRPDAYKMNPPLRSMKDREALREGCVDGTLDVLATDHAPHTREGKALGFERAPFGVLGLETAIGVTHSLLVETGHLSIPEWIQRWTCAPARALDLREPDLEPGSAADLVLLDLHSEWVVDPGRFYSRSRNTSFAGWTLRGRAAYTVLGGRITWSEQAPFALPRRSGG